jgi:tetratricopeptide (TPR) repeat protein
MRTLPTHRPQRKPRSDRRQRVPPALTRGADRVDGISILDEIGGDLGLLLWRSARNVALWSETPADQRASLFDGAAARSRGDELAASEVHAELRGPLSVFTELLARPGEVDLLRLVNACRRVALWAEHRGALATALQFSQAAALTAPESAALAYAVGRLARRRAEYDRAESWYTRAVVQGRQTRDWRSYALAFSGMGNLHMQRGNYPAARRSHLRCLRVSERKGLLELVGSAYHDLFLTAVENGAGGEADDLSVLAFQAYGRNDPRVPRLAYDVAYHWALQGFFDRSLKVAETLLVHMNDDSERAVVFGLIARTAAGVGDRERFLVAARETRLLAEREAARETAARALLGVVYGAANLGEWELAQDVGTRAVAIARRRGEGRVLLASEAALESVQNRFIEPAVPVVPSVAAEDLATSFVAVLGAVVMATA